MKDDKPVSRADFIFTLGYEGDTAVVDKAAHSRFRKLDAQGLIEKGLFKAAVCSAIYNEDEDEFQEVLEAYNARSARKVGSVEELKKVFGILMVPPGVRKVKYV